MDQVEKPWDDTIATEKPCHRCGKTTGITQAALDVAHMFNKALRSSNGKLLGWSDITRCEACTAICRAEENEAAAKRLGADADAWRRYCDGEAGMTESALLAMVSDPRFYRGLIKRIEQSATAKTRGPKRKLEL